MQTKLNLKLSKEKQRKFPIAQKFFVLYASGKKIQNIPWINLFIVTHEEKISFFLDMYPLTKSSLYYGIPPIPEINKDKSEDNIHHVINCILFPQELTILPNGFPWEYANRKEQFKNLPDNTTCIIFWCGEYELRINNTYQFFDNIIEMLKRE